MRNEAHRFGIKHHRGKREKDLFHSELDDIKGIGEKTRENLMKNFDSVDKIKASSLDQLKAVVGQSKAEKILEYFHEKKEK